MESEKAVEQPNSCKISVNAKGQYSGEVKVYSATIEIAFGKAVEMAGKLEEHIKAKNGG